jgi:hypothetical protein
MPASSQKVDALIASFAGELDCLTGALRYNAALDAEDRAAA